MPSVLFTICDTPASAITSERTMRDFMRYCYKEKDRVERGRQEIPGWILGP
jgi:hypothetical protein